MKLFGKPVKILEAENPDHICIVSSIYCKAVRRLGRVSSGDVTNQRTLYENGKLAAFRRHNAFIEEVVVFDEEDVVVAAVSAPHYKTNKKPNKKHRDANWTLISDDDGYQLFVRDKTTAEDVQPTIEAIQKNTIIEGIVSASR
ncbi:MAG: hypothetical protein GY804_04895 [Alphaproteobacteria bacterium]|nr:hypothetical protein [Alphaproteobacteria bacterium]